MDETTANELSDVFKAHRKYVAILFAEIAGRVT